MSHPHSNLTRQIDNIEINIADLAAVSGIVGTSKIDTARAQGFRTVQQKDILTLDGTGVGSAVAGPILVGFAEAVLSIAEIEEAIENDPQSQKDQPATEQAGRKIFFLGYLGTEDSNQSQVRFTTKHKVSYIEGTNLLYFAYNTDLNTNVSATTQVKIFCEHLGVWLRD